MKHVTIVGGSGFIGTRLCKRLSDSGVATSSIVDRKMSDDFPQVTRIADVRDLAQLREAIDFADVIVNLAAEHKDNVEPRSLYDEVNVEGAKNVCTVAREKEIDKIVFTSSVAVYGFAPVGTGEAGEIRPFNDYGRTKAEAEDVYRAWQAERPDARMLFIVRPTVVFGERNRGNVYFLLRQLHSGKFVMVGNGRNRKSMAYVENVAAFVEQAMDSPAGQHLYNYVDKPDMSMSELVDAVNQVLGRESRYRIRIPYWLGYGLGKLFDAAAAATGREFPISAIRVKKFCSDTVFTTSCGQMGFEPPVMLHDAMRNTIEYEFLEKHGGERVSVR